MLANILTAIQDACRQHYNIEATATLNETCASMKWQTFELHHKGEYIGQYKMLRRDYEQMLKRNLRIFINQEHFSINQTIQK